MCGTGVSSRSTSAPAAASASRPLPRRTAPGSPGRGPRARSRPARRRAARASSGPVVDPREEARHGDDRRGSRSVWPEAHAPSSSRRPARTRRARRARAGRAGRRGRRPAEGRCAWNVSGSGVGIPPSAYQWRPPGGEAERPARSDAEQAPLGVEQVEERVEVVLVGSAAVEEDERACRLAGRLPPASRRASPHRRRSPRPRGSRVGQRREHLLDPGPAGARTPEAGSATRRGAPGPRRSRSPGPSVASSKRTPLGSRK